MTCASVSGLHSKQCRKAEKEAKKDGMRHWFRQKHVKWWKSSNMLSYIQNAASHISPSSRKYLWKSQTSYRNKIMTWEMFLRKRTPIRQPSQRELKPEIVRNQETQHWVYIWEVRHWKLFILFQRINYNIIVSKIERWIWWPLFRVYVSHPTKIRL